MNNTPLKFNAYKNYISLGTRCYVAAELGKFNLRNKSYPFDWLVCNYSLIQFVLNNRKMPDSLFDETLLFQLEKAPYAYFNYEYECIFYHDYLDNKPLDKQINKVSKKYKRRTNRFIKAIKEPTLFIRFVESQKEAKYIENHRSEILDIIKNYNMSNNIIFVTTKEISDKDIFYLVNANEVITPETIIAMHPISGNHELNVYFSNVVRKKRIGNMFVYFYKVILCKKAKKIYWKLFIQKKPKYKHYQTVSF